MNKKKMMAAFIGATMLISAGAPAFAADNNMVDAARDAAVHEVVRMPERELAFGTITAINKNDKGDIQSITIKVPAREDTELVLNVGIETITMDSGTGIPVGLKDLKIGDSIYAFHSPAMTMSLPPQTFAEAIVCNVPADARSAMLHTVEEVENTKDGIRVLVDGGSLYISAGKDAKISPLYTKNIVTLGDVKVGDRIFAWYDIVLTSYPGQATTEKLVLMPGKRDTVVQPVNDKLQIVLNSGNPLAQQALVKNDVVMVPLRAVAEALGYAVSWNGADQTAVVQRAKSELSLTAKIGTDGANVDENYRTWVSAETFKALGANVVIDLENASVKISTKNA